MRKTTLLFVLTALLTGPLYADDPVNMNTIVVTGTRTPKLLKDTPVQTRVITSDQIVRSGAANIGDLLQAELPAIEFSYSMNQQTSLNMQGFGGMSVLILVDGERLAGETLDNVDYARLGMDNVQRVEIVKGAASSLYGSNALGGVVNIITKAAAEPWAVALDTRYGSHNALRNGAKVSFRQGRVNSVTQFRHASQDATYLGPSIGLDGRPKENFLYANCTYSLTERLGIKISDKIDLVAKGGYYFRERDYMETMRNRYRDFSGGLRMNYHIDPRNYLEVSYNFDQYDKSNFYTEKQKDIRNYSNIQNSVRALFNHTFDGGHILTAGGDAMNDHLSSYQFEGNARYDMTSADAFVQFDWQVVRQVSIVGGARLDYFSGKDRLRLSPKVAVMYRPGNFALRGSYAGGFRAPTLKEMHMAFDMGSIFWIYGNPDLRSETSHNLMLSGEYSRRRWSASVSGYWNSVDDRILTVWNDRLHGRQYVNTPHVDIAGAEANFSLKLAGGFGARLSYACTKELLGRGELNVSGSRPHTAVAMLEYGRDWKNYGFNVALSGRYMSPVDTHILTPESYFMEYQPIRYPGYTMWKLTVSQKIWRPFTLVAAVDNLFNYKVDYYYDNSPALYGTVFSVGLSMNIEEIFK